MYCSKEKRANRFRQKKRYINKQSNIVALSGIEISVPHKFHKKSALTCGNSNCVMCMNPRKAFKEKTIQERKALEEDLESWPSG
jgi:hypothetical protein